MGRLPLRSVGLLAAGTGLLAAFAVGVDAHLGATTAAPPAAGTAAPDPMVAGSGLGDSQAGIEAAQQRLQEVPGDWVTWARLGVASIEQARITADPSWYPKAQDALEESLELRPEGNTAAMAGMGALANARHDFTEAARWAERALQVDRFDHTSLGVLADARIQLGRYQAATRAAQRMVDVRPDVPALTRASYDLQLQGRLDEATAVMQRALGATTSGPGRAWVRTHLAELAFATGELGVARDHLEAGLEVAPDDPALQAGMARVLAAEGRTEDAVGAWQAVVAARPLPEHLAEFGAYLASLGRDQQAQEQFDVLATVQELFASNGVADDLTGAIVEADHGDPADAVRHARSERDRRDNVESADALAWALHSAGRDSEALPLAVEATAHGRDATRLYHRGMIERSLGKDRAARRHLRAALDLNPHFSPLHAPRARAALDALGST